MSVKSMVKEHFTIGSEHLKKHGTLFFSEKNSGDVNAFKADNTVFNDITLSKYYESIEMREFRVEDMDMCVEVYREVFSADPWNDDWISSDQVRYYLNELVENPVFEGFVAYENSNIVAACFGHKRSWWTGKDFFIDELFVTNKMQGIGVGTKLIDYMESNPVIADCVRLILLTNKDLPAEEFYNKKGFKINKKRIYMVKSL